ncbi:ABC transporter substrate-binding protein [Paenibacillus harenae]|uniref:ABC transporter substrate-binding protein n=1 Tax=Paenibacillus harenae TaxID=306543 RepID=UPI002790F3DC|nr:ABC transporter substrate-binding protein [Paenibacillus harenae]MDQ0057841.1 iron complex transport system substrate-binding protein [Paenibacillus harenae]
MSRTKMKVSLLVIAGMAMLAACSNNTSNNKGDVSSPAPTETIEPTILPASEAVFKPITIEDDTGEALVFNKPVEKVACVVSLCVDVLIELGMEPIAIAESGVRTIATSPEFFGSKGESIPSIGGSFFEPSIEDLVTAEPDLVIGLKGVHDSLREGLKGVVPLVLSNPSNYMESIAFLETIGKLTGKTLEAEEAKQRFLDKLNDAMVKAPKNKKALIIFGSDVNFSVVTGSGLGGTVMKEISNYPWKVEKPEDDPYGEGSVPYSLEKLLVENPDVIFVESYSFSPGTKPISEQLAASPIWSKLKAVQNQQVHEVRSPIWGDGRGTRSLGIMLDESLAIMYPDLF